MIKTKHKLLTEVLSVTPDLALEWLAKNTRNRPIRKTHVQDLADRMRRGEWHLNGEPIKFSTSGVLLDGQHRLEAVLESECTVEFMVVYNLAEEAYETIDTGMKRTMADFFAVRDEKHSKQLSSALRYLSYLLAGRTDFNSRFTNSQALNVLETHSNVRNSLDPGLDVARLMQAGLAAALHYLFSSVDPEKAEEFFERLATGADLCTGHPILQLRQRLLERPKGYQIRPVMAAALTIKSWNAFYQNRQMVNLRWRQSGETPEPFPAIERSPVTVPILRKRKKAS